MNWFPLPIFPEESLASSVVTTVWIGVVVFTLFNLRFGWVYSGLVVPGYLIPLAIEKPYVALIVVCEAILTLWTVKLIMAALPKFGLACELFGRDRFFAMILVSAFYRLIFDVSILPQLGRFLDERFGLAFDYQNNLHSFGLIVICLLANQLFKTGVIKGAIPFLTVMGTTYIIIRFGLMEFTNFSLTSLSFLYEDVAASVYAAPKAYIILITASIVASRLNLRYGWDFNGIMIPALLSIQWYEPLKIVTSIVEALVILNISMMLMKLPPFNSMTVEGSRKVLFFFTVSFAYKMLMGWTLYLVAPEVKVSDYYGFGYLLPTLMAIKMHALNKVVHQIRITVQVSLVSVAVANVMGLALSLLPSFMGSAFAGEKQPPQPGLAVAEKPVETVFREEMVNLYRLDRQFHPPGREIELSYHFSQALEEMFAREPDSNRLKFLMDQAKCRFDRLENGMYVIRPELEARRGFYLVNPESSSQLTVEVPGAATDHGISDVGLAIFSDQDARILAVIDNRNSDEIGKDPYNRMVQNRFSPRGIVRLQEGETPALYVTRKIPAGLSLKSIEDSVGEFETIWEKARALDIERTSTANGFCQLNVNSIDWGIKNGETDTGNGQ